MVVDVVAALDVLLADYDEDYKFGGSISFHIWTGYNTHYIHRPTTCL